MKIRYNIIQVEPRIFAVVVPSKYDRAMLFCRAQEFYESTSSKFRGKKFSIWDYMSWYGKRSRHGFSYGADWSGFNIPAEVVEECYKTLGQPETPYDQEMLKILAKVKSACPVGGYIIACRSTRGEVFRHELCHARFYSDPAYRQVMTSMVKSMNNRCLQLFRSNLRGMGYAGKVVVDEIQAYLQYGHDNETVCFGIRQAERRELNKKFRAAASEVTK